jgi:TolA-binding protein
VFRRRFHFGTALLVLLATATAARADDDVFLVKSKDKDKPGYKGVIKQESPLGIKIVTGKGMVDIPADQIRDVIYEVAPTSVMVGKYKPAIAKEQEAHAAKDPKVRAKLHEEAIKLFEETIQALKGEFPFALRHLDYKIAQARWQIAQDTGQAALFDKAFASLAEFRKKHPQGWQIGPCLNMLALWHLERKEWSQAEQILWEVSGSSLPEESRKEAELLALEMMSRQPPKQKEALGLLEVLEDKYPKGSKAQLGVRIARAECLGYGKELGKARAVVTAVLNETQDKTLRARAYNAMGVCYVLGQKWKEASWEFLWVDLIYNQDKAEHAKALYYLIKVFEELGEPDRVREWRLALEGNSYAGTLYQRWARQ